MAENGAFADWERIQPRMEELIQTFPATVPELSEIDINDNVPGMYTRSWSETLRCIVMYEVRKLGVVTEEIPTAVFDVIAELYSNDHTKNRTFTDYVDALLISKYFSALKATKRAQLSEQDLAVKTKYGMKKKAALTKSKVFIALKDYKADGFAVADLDDFEIYIVDHELNRVNLKAFSYPKGAEYNISDDELRIISATRDTLQLQSQWEQEMDEAFHGITLHSSELTDILKKGNFKSGKASIRLHTIIEFRDKMLFAMDYNMENIYFLFVLKWFSVIIHDKVRGNVAAQARTMEARVIGGRYRSILEQLDQSGL